MINSLKSSRGFITLTITLIIIILVTILSLMTGRMLMNEQRAASNKLRYEEAANAAQAGIDAALARLSLDNEFRDSFTNDSSAPFYQVAFGSDTAIQAGEGTLPVVSITAVGTSGYSAAAANADDAEAKVTVQQKAIIARAVAGAPDAPLTVSTSMGAGGNFVVGANPNGGGPGVPLSIWSKGSVTVGSSSSTCSLQQYSEDQCQSNTYSDNKSDAGSDILQNDTAGFPKNLLAYLFGFTTENQILTVINQLGHQKMSPSECGNFDGSSRGMYLVEGPGTCSLNSAGKTIGSEEHPIVIILWNADADIVANTIIYGIVFSHSESGSYNIKMGGGATIYGALIADNNVSIQATGTYNTVYDANVLNNIEYGEDFSYVARVSGSWKDGE